MLAAARHGLRRASMAPGLRRGMATAANDTPLAEFEPPSVFVTLSNLIPPAATTPKTTEVIQLDRTVFGEVVRRDILHLCVVHHRDGLRQGSANTKNRAEVRGSGRKIRPQKGSGRARLGDGQSPMLRGGGVAFGPKPRDFSTKLPFKVRQLGLRVALSARLKSNGLGVVPSLDWPGEKTKPFAKRINELRWRRTVLVTGLNEIPEGLRRASRNLSGIKIVHASELDVYSVIRSPRVVLDVHAVDWLEQKLGKGDPLPLVSPEVVTRMMEDIKLRAEQEEAYDDVANAEINVAHEGGLLEPELVQQTPTVPQ